MLAYKEVIYWIEIDLLIHLLKVEQGYTSDFLNRPLMKRIHIHFAYINVIYTCTVETGIYGILCTDITYLLKLQVGT